MVRWFRPESGAPPVYYVTPSGGVLEPVVLSYLDDKTRRDMKKTGARLFPRKHRRAEMRRQRHVWPVLGGAPKQASRECVRAVFG